MDFRSVVASVYLSFLPDSSLLWPDNAPEQWLKQWQRERHQAKPSITDNDSVHWSVWLCCVSSCTDSHVTEPVWVMEDSPKSVQHWRKETESERPTWRLNVSRPLLCSISICWCLFVLHTAVEYKKEEPWGWKKKKKRCKNDVTVSLVGHFKFSQKSAAAADEF